MIARRALPAGFLAWNRRWGAPEGLPRGRRLRRRVPRLVERVPRLIGPFGFQPNNSTRLWEYPWAHEAVGPRPGQVVVDVGGGLGGLQFVLAREGASVTNVDPGLEASGVGWPVTADRIGRLNRAFGTDVRLRSTTLPGAELPAESVDTVVSVSTVEHIPPPELPGLFDEILRVLRPGGRFVATVDLFLDLRPFTTRDENRWGTNIDLGGLLEPLDADLVVGRTDELAGYDRFDPERILAGLSEYLIGSAYPALAQCFVIEKRR